jgi:hypothetical protein
MLTDFFGWGRGKILTNRGTGGNSQPMARECMSLPLTSSVGRIAPRFRLVRVPAPRDKFFRPLRPRFHWNHDESFRRLGLGLAVAWGRRNVVHLDRSLDAPPHRTRGHHVCLVQRWDSAAALRQKAPELLRALHPTPGETLSLSIEDAKQAKRGQAMDAVAKMKAPTIDASIRGHQDVCGILVFRQEVLPDGIRLYVNKAPCASVGVPFRTTPELAAPLIRACKPPAGVTGMVLFAAS